MRILQVSKYYPPYFGGVEQVVSDITTGINSTKELKCDVLAVNHEKSYIKEEKSDYFIYRSKPFLELFSTPISLSFLNMYRKLCTNYDLIHIHLPNPLSTLGAFLFRSKAKIVLHWHSDIIKQKKLLKLFEPLQKWLLIKSDCIVATSPKYGLESKSLAKFQEKVVSIPIGIDRMNGVKETLVNEIRSKHREKKIVFSLGRLVYYKGFEYLIKAAKHLADDYVVLIGGVGPLENKLKSLVKSENLQQRVYLIGKIAYDDLPSYYEAADIFCMSSIEASEAFGVVQLEAMSLGKPVVSTKISRSGVDWVNADKVSGITVDVRSSVKIAEAIEEICSNPQLYKKLSEGAYQRFENMFNKEIMVNSIADLYLTYCK